MANWVVGFKVQAFPGKAEELAKILADAPKMDIPGNVAFLVGIQGDMIFGYEEWTSQMAWNASLLIPEVRKKLEEALPMAMLGPEIIFQGHKVDPEN